MPNYNSTARVPFAKGGKVTKKTTMGEFSKGKQLRPGIRLKGGKSFIEEYRRRLNKKADGGRIDFKKGKAVTKADTARSDLWRKRQLKKRADAKRKSKWDVYGGIAAHPLNPFRIHAEEKSKGRVYERTRDKLKKSKDPDVKGVAEGFQKMDWKDEARSDPRYVKGSKYYKEHSPKLKKKEHKRKKADGGRIDFKHGGQGRPVYKETKKERSERIISEKKRKRGYIIRFKHGKPEPRRKTLAVTDKYKKIRDSLGLKKGGKADNKWIQKATKGMRKDKPCTGKKFGSATCPPGSKRYNLAKTFKKMARSKHASGDMVRYI